MQGDEDLAALASRVGEVLRERGWRLSTAESCTGGWIAKLMTDIAGSSEWFEAGVVSYSNAAKQKLLSVPAGHLRDHGAVSEPVARAMAEGARARIGGDIAVAVTGVAGPGGGTADKPVGTVWFAWARRGGTTEAEQMRFPGDRDAVRRATVAHALDRVLRLVD